MSFPRLHGIEFVLLPVVTAAYFVWFTDFTWPGALLNNSIVTAASAAVAFWRSKQIAEFAVRRNDRRERLAPVGPFVAGMVLAFGAALQLIFAVTHVSYYRKGPLVADMFDR